MNAINQSIAQDRAKSEQLARRRRQELYAQERRQKKRDDALTFKIGCIVRENWPWTARFQLRQSKVANDIEFAPLTERMQLIAADPNYSMDVPEYASATKSEGKCALSSTDSAG